ncbi:hypothetical protein YT1_3840 [Rhodococcus ruber]|nr:hypothetical protein YT1_3840 [Rhodococcus ruber]
MVGRTSRICPSTSEVIPMLLGSLGSLVDHVLSFLSWLI